MPVCPQYDSGVPAQRGCLRMSSVISYVLPGSDRTVDCAVRQKEGLYLVQGKDSVDAPRTFLYVPDALPCCQTAAEVAALVP